MKRLAFLSAHLCFLPSAPGRSAPNPGKLWVSVFLIGLILGGCGTEYQPGDTPAQLRILHRGITHLHSPLTLPARPDKPFHLRARVHKPNSPRFHLESVSWGWTRNQNPVEDADGPTFSSILADTVHRITVTARVRWSVDENGSSRHVLQTLSHRIHPSLAREKQPGQSVLQEYRIGSFPDVSGTFSRLGPSLVVLKPRVPFYEAARSGRPLGTLSKGERLPPARSPVPRQNSRVLVEVEHRDVWIPDTAVLLPPSVRFHPEKYRKPRWYYPVNETNAEGFVLPHLRWKQFDHDPDYRLREGPPYPHFIPLDHRLLEKVRGLQKVLQSRGHSPRIELVSGVRNPHYNLGEYRGDQSLKALFSRHQYGDAVDLIVDGSLNGRMDDLNDDGRVDLGDASLVGRLMETWEQKHQRFGGIGVYGHHDVDRLPETPYVHIDTRGFKARWTIR